MTHQMLTPCPLPCAHAAKACKKDAEAHCNVTWFFGYKNGSIISCLRDVKDKLSPACKKEVFKVQLAASQDFRADPALYEACKKDADTLCKDIPHGGGRVQACLVSTTA
jgi:Golgi apparatus protein 1